MKKLATSNCFCDSCNYAFAVSQAQKNPAAKAGNVNYMDKNVKPSNDFFGM
jgi:hypothetical protein